MLAQVIVDDQCVLAVVAEILANRSSCERCEILHRVRIGSSGNDDGGVFHCTVILERLHNTGNGGLLLAASDVDAVNRAAAGLVSLLLIKNRVDADRALSGAAVADNELALATADRDHGVDCLDTGLHWLRNR